MSAPPMTDLLARKQILVDRLGNKFAVYWDCLRKFFQCKLTKKEVDAYLYNIIGTDNVPYHNSFMRAILRNAHNSLSFTLPVDRRRRRAKKLRQSRTTRPDYLARLKIGYPINMYRMQSLKRRMLSTTRRWNLTVSDDAVLLMMRALEMHVQCMLEQSRPYSERRLVAPAGDGYVDPDRPRFVDDTHEPSVRVARLMTAADFVRSFQLFPRMMSEDLPVNRERVNFSNLL